ncbi:MAG: hypothetical protein KC493_01350 [Bacteriovoracaceae bacterium]|nr:hypothetical protein [Bacteriovoracaceae bacterium]
MKNIITLCILGLMTSTAFANDVRLIAEKFDYEGGFSIPVYEHCKEKGYIRPLNPHRKKCVGLFGSLRGWSPGSCRPENVRSYFLKKPALQFNIFNLGHEKFFHKIEYIKTKGYLIKYIPLNEQSMPIDSREWEEKFDIPDCSHSEILLHHEMVQHLKATPQQVMLFSALHQNGVRVIDKETFTIKDIMNGKPYEFQGLGYSPQAKLWYRSPNCKKGNLVSVDPGQLYQYLRNLGGEGTGSGRTIGGEGSGSGLVKVNMNLSTSDFKDLRFEPNDYERTMGLKPRYYEYIKEGKDIPNHLISVGCQEGNK